MTACGSSPIVKCQHIQYNKEQNTAITFIQDGPKDGKVVLDGGAVPPAPPKLVLALLDPQLDTFSDAGHDLDVVATESQLLGHEARYRATQDGLGAQR